FLDDDLAVEPGWLAAILDAIERYDFDAMFGAISAEFADPTSYSEVAEQTFTRKSDLPAGATLKALKRGARQAFPLSTANCILRRASLDRLDGLFDPRFGQSGGEDFHLFLRLEQSGGAFGWLPDAGCIEQVPAHRCSTDYLARRYYAGSQAFAAAQVVTSGSPRVKAVLIAGKAYLQLLSLRIQRALLGYSGEKPLLREAGIRGKISWRELHPVYAQEARSLKQAE
ncbi:MAG: glycosyltransferase family 2 protein, partial [Salinarimonas sp.]